MEIHERIRELRESKEMSRKAFGEVLGVSGDVINNIESNRLKRPEQKEPLYKLICEKFNVNEKWLRTGEGNMFLPAINEEADYVSELLEDVENPLYDLIKAIMKTYLEADEKQKQVIKSFAKDLNTNIKKESQD